ncbi:MAG: hypothetical protein FJZ60_03635, partial [Chlamydiae bacterium]|nr:hypothetical protein [Chlamydiota bacterium]
MSKRIFMSMYLLSMLFYFHLTPEKKRLQRDLLDTAKFFKLIKEIRLDEKKKLADSPFIEKSIRVEIADYPTAYNASIIPFKDKYLLAFRTDRYRLPLAKNLVHFRNYIGLVLLDQNFKTIQEPVILEKLGSRCYDPRLFMHLDRLYMSYGSAYESDPDAVSRSRINLVEICHEGGQFFVSQSIAMKMKNIGTYEKNWSIFSHNDQIFYTYQIQPHKVLRVDTLHGFCNEVALTETPFSWNFGVLRGGTPALEREDCYLAFLHSGIWFIGRHFYFMGAYTFSKTPPFEILKMSVDPFFFHDFYTSERNPNIISNVTFPGGYFIQNGKIYLCYGENDAA